MHSPLASLTSGRLLAKNTSLNLLGQAIPLVTAVIVVPTIIRGLGTDRFGVLTLAWVMIGYFSLFDLGLGRALGQIVAERLGGNRQNEISSLIPPILGMALFLGLIGSLLFATISPLLIDRLLQIPIDLRHEALVGFYILAASLPFVTTTSGLIGILQAFQRFDLLNYVRIPVGVLVFVGPVLVLPFSRRLTGVILVLALVRVLMCCALALICYRCILPAHDRPVGRSYRFVTIFRFASWMTVSNIVGPILVYLDRFIICMFLSVAAVAYYSTPYEVVTKLWIVPASFTGVLFPAFATSFVKDKAHTVVLFTRGVKYVFLILFPLVLLTVTFAKAGLHVWLGDEFAVNGTLVMQLLAVGVLLNSLGLLPFTLLQAIGRPDFTAKLHLAELPIYIVVASYLVWQFGINGAAVAWVIRVASDTFVLFFGAGHFIPATKAFYKRLALALTCALVAVAVAVMIVSSILKVAFTVVVLLTYFFIAWALVLDSRERNLIRSSLGFNVRAGLFS